MIQPLKMVHPEKWRVRRRAAVLLMLSAWGFSFARSLAQAPGPASTPPQPSDSSAKGSSPNIQIVMKAIAFNPLEQTVHPGDTVEWKNEDIVAHTVTADDGSFDSGLIQPGHSWKMTVKSAATIAYHCSPHPNMKAKLIEAGTTAQAQNSGHTSWSLPGFNPPRFPHELHPILVNFTAALLPLALLSDLLGLWLRRPSLHNAAFWMVLYEAIITPLTGLAGWWWKFQTASTLPPNLIAVHQWLGTSLVVLVVILAGWRWRIHKKNATPTVPYLLFAAVVMLALVYQGSLGGLMVFGR
jgi:plastocyanin/uncharacterized membrane protein